MTVKEKYNLPEGSNATLKYFNPVYGYEGLPLLENSKNLFENSVMPFVPELDVSQVTDMDAMFRGSKCLYNPLNMADWNTSNVTSMANMFSGASSYPQTVEVFANWDVSNVKSMSGMFSNWSNLKIFDISTWDTSKVTTMQNMLNSCNNLEYISAIDCSSISSANYYPITVYSDMKFLTDVGGFMNMKYSWSNTYGLYKCPNLNRESCINVLNGLYDFTGETPTSQQGQLKVHSNFITAVGDDISIATNKGWVVSA